MEPTLETARKILAQGHCIGVGCLDCWGFGCEYASSSYDRRNDLLESFIASKEAEQFPPLKIGDRVKRGPDWEWGIQDGGAEGVVSERLDSDGWVKVRWDNGFTEKYRYGYNGKHDIAKVETKETTMDKAKAIKRLDAIEGEAKELREIIERGDRLEYDEDKLYVAILLGKPYLLCGSAFSNYFRWHSFVMQCTVQGWSFNHETAQAALDYVANGGKVYAFTDRFEGMKFFYDKYMENR